MTWRDASALRSRVDALCAQANSTQLFLTDGQSVDLLNLSRDVKAALWSADMVTVEANLGDIAALNRLNDTLDAMPEQLLPRWFASTDAGPWTLGLRWWAPSERTATAFVRWTAPSMSIRAPCIN